MSNQEQDNRVPASDHLHHNKNLRYTDIPSTKPGTIGAILEEEENIERRSGFNTFLGVIPKISDRPRYSMSTRLQLIAHSIFGRANNLRKKLWIGQSINNSVR